MSDVTDRNLILAIFLVSYIYIQFLAMQSRNRSGWSNLTCNPLGLFVNSLFQTQEEATKDFQRCVVNISASTTTDLFQKERAGQEEVLANMSTIETEYANLTDAVVQYKSKIDETTEDYTQKIEVIKELQKDANQLNQTTSGVVQEYLTNVQTIFNNIASYFQKK